MLTLLVPFLVWPGRKAWKAANLSWQEVRRIVLWRKRRRSLGFAPGWTSQVGLEKIGDDADLSSRSVRLGPAAFKDLERAAARYAPHVEIVDERAFGAVPDRPVR